LANQRQIDIYSAGCAVCEDAVKMVQGLACPSCNITVMDMTDPNVASQAKSLGIKAVPAIVIDGQLADCCFNGGPNADALRAAGIGSPLP
jgi:glutaredoxin 3